MTAYEILFHLYNDFIEKNNEALKYFEYSLEVKKILGYENLKEITKKIESLRKKLII